MYWLKPSLLPRRAVAVVLVLGALAWDLRGSPTVPYPFTGSAVGRGQPVTSIEWRDVPAGLLPESADTGIAAVDLPPGAPILAAALRSPISAPQGWWAVPVEAAAHAAAGDTVMLVSADPPFETTGIVTSAQQGDRYGSGFRPALVAVPESHAAAVASAAARGALLAAVRPDGGEPPPGE